MGLCCSSCFIVVVVVVAIVVVVVVVVAAAITVDVADAFVFADRRMMFYHTKGPGYLCG